MMLYIELITINEEEMIQIEIYDELKATTKTIVYFTI